MRIDHVNKLKNQSFVALAFACVLFLTAARPATKVPKRDIRSQSQFQSCLLITIKRIKVHEEYMYHGDRAKLEATVQIDDVLKAGTMYNNQDADAGFRNGATITFVLDKPELLPGGENQRLVGTRAVWGVDWWRINPGFYHLDKLIDVFPSHKFTNQDLQKLKARLKS